MRFTIMKNWGEKLGNMDKNKYKRMMALYMVAISCIAIGLGLGDSIMANYFDEAYHATVEQRAFIEFPREIPGILAIVVIAWLSRIGDVRLAVLSQVLSAFGIFYLAFHTPSFAGMCVMLFVFSMGTHIYLSLQDSLAITLLSQNSTENTGRSLGNIKGWITACSLPPAAMVFFGFRTGVFSFTTPVKLSFVLAGVCAVLAAILLALLVNDTKQIDRVQPKLVIRKKYIYYYILAIMNGAQKQIILVFAPWVIIQILGKGADTIALLLMISAVCGMFFLPFLGRCLDKYGLRAMFYADALSYIGVYLFFAFMVYGVYVGNFSTTGWAAFVICCTYVLDRMSSQMTFIRSIYLNQIAIDKAEVTATLSFGIALDHIVAIICACFSAYIWTQFGPHMIFIFAASLSLVNLVIAKIVPLAQGT